MPRPFAPPGTATHYVPDRPVAVSHVRLSFEPDMAARTLHGQSRLSLTARQDGLDKVELNAVDMTIEQVSVDGKPVSGIDYDGERLRIELGRAFTRGARFTLVVDYRCKPRRGLYFVGPDQAHPDHPLECWSQGQDDDSRFYWPCVDLPVEKASSEVFCTVPAGVTVLSNGDLADKSDLPDGRTRWHYVLDLPHSPYLVTLVCGPFTELKERAPETGVDVYYYAPKGREEDTRRSLGRTPEMIDFFSRRIGVPYPHRRYSQVFVHDFIFGGMENTTATTLTSEAMLDQRAALDHDVEGLVSHELAHQWWGDLLTCREWPEAWLNEGFATYFEYVWREHTRGRDEADVELLGDLDAYLGEAGTYQRPLVCRQYEAPIDLFDRHLYEKGGRVLHMLRHELGEDNFWRALRLYGERHARGSVETRDLARAVEEATSRNLDWFFDQWVGSPGHPELEGAWEWDADKKAGTLRLEQKQSSDRPPRFTTRVLFEVEGVRREETVEVDQRSHAFEFHLAARPTQVIFDPGDVVLKSIKLKKPRALWERQLQAARLGVDRVLAARALADLPEPATVAALAAALESDSFWAVRAAAAAALGKTRRQDALDALLKAREQENPRVRRAAAAALGDFVVTHAPGNQRAAELLEGWVAGGDASCFVEAAAALALGRTRSPRAAAVLSGLLSRNSFQDMIRARAIDGLGATGDEAALPLVEAAFAPGASIYARRAIVGALARLAEGTLHARHARECLEGWLCDPDFRVRMDAASGLAALADARAVPAIEAALHAELDGRAKRRMREAIGELRERGKPEEKLRKLSDEVERLAGESTRLRERLEGLENQVRPPLPATPPASGPSSAAPPRSKRPRPGSRRSSKPLAPRRRR
ncbi:MAG: M1 family aminopeptidase [Polyangia bacterium]|jgi:aminopeptidase N